MTRKKQKRHLRVGRLAILLVVVGAIGAGAAAGGMYLYKSRSVERESEAERTSPVASITHSEDVKAIQNASVLSSVVTAGFSDEELRACFFSRDIDLDLLERMNKIGYADEVHTEDLQYVRVLYYDFEGAVKVGEMIVHKDIAQKVENVFYDLFTHHYPIGKIILPDAYASLADAYADNDTVALSFELDEENDRTSHATGYAIDLNPLYNPLIKDNGSSISVYPMEAQLYLDRTVNAPYYIYKDDYAVQAFEKEGFVWKGSVTGMNDYKHFVYPHAAPSAAISEQSQSEEEAGVQESQAEDVQQEPLPEESVEEEVWNPQQSGQEPVELTQELYDAPYSGTEDIEQMEALEPGTDPQPYTDVVPDEYAQGYGW